MHSLRFGWNSSFQEFIQSSLLVPMGRSDHHLVSQIIHLSYFSSDVTPLAIISCAISCTPNQRTFPSYGHHVFIFAYAYSSLVAGISQSRHPCGHQSNKGPPQGLHSRSIKFMFSRLVFTSTLRHSNFHSSPATLRLPSPTQCCSPSWLLCFYNSNV
jgi:hypothetical protein